MAEKSYRTTHAGLTNVMSDIHTLALRQADQARTDFAAIESDLEVISEADCATADAPGASQDRARHNLREMMLTTLSLLFLLR